MSHNITLIGLGSLGKVIVQRAKCVDINLQAIMRNASRLETSYDFYGVDGQLIKTTIVCHDITSLKTTSLVIITVKAFSIVECLEQLDEYIPLSVPIVIISNGMGIKERIEHSLPHRKLQLYQAITTMAAYTDISGTYWVSKGFTYYGRMFPLSASSEFSYDAISSNIDTRDKTHNLPHVGETDIINTRLEQNECFKQREELTLFEALFLDEGCKSIQFVHSIEHYQREKLYLNASINPLTVKYRCLNGELLNHLEELKQLFDEIMDFEDALQQQALLLKSAVNLTERDKALLSKNSSVMKSNSSTIKDLTCLCHSKIESNTLSDREALFSKLLDVIHKTKANQSSMLQDYLASKPLEIEAITGFLLEQAEQLGLCLKYNNALYLEVKKLAEANLTCKSSPR